MSFEIDFDNPLIRHQDLSLSIDPDAFNAELAPARTFGLLDDWPRLKAAGLARGGSLDNAVVVSGDRVLNADGLRFADEFVRHKLVDAIGDLFLAGGAIIGHFRGSAFGPCADAPIARGGVRRSRGVVLYDDVRNGRPRRAGLDRERQGRGGLRTASAPLQRRPFSACRRSVL